MLSSLDKIAIAFVGAFLRDSVHLGGLFILFIDYLGVAAWYLWLVGQSTEARAKLRNISCYIIIMVIILLVITILGTHWKLWAIALEVFSLLLSTPCQQR